MEYLISDKDKQILRETAKKQLELANMDSNKARIQEWYRHNALQGEKPMIHLEMGTFSQEIIPPLLKCEGTFAQQVETALYSNFLNQELFDDDRVTPDYFPIEYDTFFELFGIQIHVDHTQDASGKESLGHHFESIIEDLEEDYEKLKPSRYGVNLETTEQKKAAVEEAIGDILPVKMQMSCLYSVPTQMLVHFMSMENMMFAMYDYPDLFKEMMGRIADDTLAYYKMLEEKRLILPTTTFEGVGQGTWSFTTELPGWDEWERRPFTTKEVWGFMDSQETVGISPDMYEEFIFPCYEKIASSYGLLSYGCCEPVDPIWDKCLSRLTNLRKVSISPWCNEEFMGERLRGSKVIYHRKPSPNFLGVDPVLDEDAFRAHIRKSLTAARGCKMEITQRDVYTIHNNIPKARRYVSLIREEIENNWKA
ncbi:hypothetical protein BLA28_23850 [Eisenbergiella tayi]|uniref:Uroporphyrinogen decarboxylase (URO-D) domain-containing protein n=1 Tax=Eisenbergiella tayi TaxID=1432052 RepID=A0A1E3ANQ7_9FIRM|nr:hypothetical protein [Eisenbergiella tayi]ODM10121.1 hypothetical protein BEH84_04490 [Eisenbergiella tayi]OIZ61522.1 hypothetical protein BLA28_23850 [Eisenbergiella tayi]